MAKKLRVAVVMETFHEHGRAALRGVASYVERGCDWELRSVPMGQADSEMLRAAMNVDGVIVRLHDAWADIVSTARVPMVGIYHPASSSIPCVKTNPKPIAELAADHFLSQGFRNFGFVGSSRPFSLERAEFFDAALAAKGFTCDKFLMRPGIRYFGWIDPHDRMMEWLRNLPTPVALLCANDWIGQQVLLNCQHANLRVPDDIAVIGIDNDELICRLTNPPLSSIDIAGERVGFEAAALLDRLLKGKRLSKSMFLVEPSRVVIRQSSDVLAVSDPNVSAAVQFIRNSVAKGINVQDVMRQIPVARRTLELAFQKFLGHSIHEEITESRIRKVKQLLIETHMPVPDICDVCGFKDRTYLSAVFRDRTGYTPASFRKQFRAV